MVQKILTFVSFWLISTSVTREALGAWTFAFAFVSFFSFLNDLGLVTVLTREAARHPKEKQAEHFNAVLTLKIPLTIITVLVTLIALYISHRSFEVQVLVIISSIMLALDAFTQSFYGIIRANQNFKYESIGLTIFQVINILIVVILLFFTKNIIWLIGAVVAAALFNFFFAFWVVKRKMGIKIKFAWQPSVIKHILTLTPAFTMALIINKVYNAADSVLLGFLRGESEVGLYSIPTKAVVALQALIPMAFVITLFPAFSYYFEKSKEKLQEIFEKSVGYLIMVAMPTAFGLYVLIPKILEFIWPDYADAITTFRIMALALPFAFLAFPTGYFLNACNAAAKTTWSRGVGLVINIVLNILLIPKFGVLGAGIAFAVTNVVQLVLDLIFIRGIVKYQLKHLVVILLKSIFASIVMNVAMVALFKLNIVLLVVLGVIIYISALLITKPFSQSEWAIITNVFRKKAQQEGPPSLNTGISTK